MELFDYPEGKTNYQIRNEHGEVTTITLEKWVADILQIELPDVHKAVQRAYDTVVKNHPELSRREKGNLIRSASVGKANEYQATKKQVLGWNDEDLWQFF